MTHSNCFQYCLAHSGLTWHDVYFCVVQMSAVSHTTLCQLVLPPIPTAAGDFIPTSGALSHTMVPSTLPTIDDVLSYIHYWWCHLLTMPPVPWWCLITYLFVMPPPLPTIDAPPIPTSNDAPSYTHVWMPKCISCPLGTQDFLSGIYLTHSHIESPFIKSTDSLLLTCRLPLHRDSHGVCCHYSQWHNCTKYGWQTISRRRSGTQSAH